MSLSFLFLMKLDGHCVPITFIECACIQNGMNNITIIDLCFSNIICHWIIQCNRWLYCILFHIKNQKVRRDIRKSPIYNNYSTFIELSVLLQLYHRIFLLPQINICPCGNRCHRQQKKSYQKCKYKAVISKMFKQMG